MPPSRLSLSCVALLALGAVAACGDPDQFLRHAKSDAGTTLPITTGDALPGGAGMGAGSTAGTAGTTTGTAGATGAAGTTTSGAAGSIAGTGAAGTTGAAGIAGTAGHTGTSGAAGSTTSTGTAGATGGGTGTAGAGGTGTCPGCKVTVMYTCLTGASDSAGFVVEAKNTGSTLLLLHDLTLRYWFTMDAGKEQELDCDTARLTCQYIYATNGNTTMPPRFVAVTPPRTKANEYVEIALTQGAIDVNGTTGPIQLRLHNKDFTPMNQMDDYSADCGQVGQSHDSGKITAYVKGVLVGGTEPQ